MRPKTITPPERDIAAAEAIERALKHCKDRRIEIAFDDLGHDHRTVFCRLSDTSGYVCVGMGKGFGAQSKASAIFEALEHYYHEHETEILCSEEVKFSRATIAQSPLENGSPFWENILGDREVVLGCLHYESTIAAASSIR